MSKRTFLQRNEQRTLWTSNASALRGQGEGPIASAPKAQQKVHKREESYESVLQQFSSRPRKKSMQELCSNSLVVVQEFALSCFFLARHRTIALLEQVQQQQQHPQQTEAAGNELDKKKMMNAFISRLEWRMDLSSLFLSFALMVVLYYANCAERSLSAQRQQQQQRQLQQSRRTKIRQRATDGLLLAVWLRLLSSLLRSLTASYSSDTVQALAAAGMTLHLFTCDYSFANGKGKDLQRKNNKCPVPANEGFKSQESSKEEIAAGTEKLAVPIFSSTNSSMSNASFRRPPFQGGTVSLNAALFTTTLLISRLSSDVSAYFFLSLAVAAFAFYPLTRSTIAASFPARSSPALWVITALMILSAGVLLPDEEYARNVDGSGIAFHSKESSYDYTYLGWFVVVLLLLGLVLPGWNFITQTQKRLLRGPWDLPTAAFMQLDYQVSADPAPKVTEL